MKFTVDKKEMMTAIKEAAKAAPASSTFKDLEALKVTVAENSVALTGYDTEMSITENLEATAHDCGEFLINIRLVNSILKTMPNGKIDFTLDENINLTISADNTDFEVPVMTAENYPEILTALDADDPIVISAEKLKPMLDETLYAVSTDQARMMLTGELFELKDGILTIVSIDGFRMAIKREKLDTENTAYFVVPAKALKEVTAQLKGYDGDVEIYSTEKHTTFKFGNAEISVRLIEGTFHKYEGSIPYDASTEIMIDREKTIKAIEQCKLLLNEKNKSPLVCNFAENVLEMSCKTGIGKFNKIMTVVQRGQDIRIGFNAKFLYEALKNVNADKVTIGMNGNNKAVKVMPEGNSGDTIHIVMPLQIRD